MSAGLVDAGGGGAFARRMMDRAARAALRGWGLVEPNPMVGCVLVTRGGAVVTGRHRVYGGLHAEAEAVAAARARGVDVVGSTVYVTLEPCAHVGKQPSCAAMLVAAGVGRVVCARRDPHADGGGGSAALEGGGVSCEVMGGTRLALYAGAPFVKCVETGLPWVIAKWAQTIDGAIATRGGVSKWVSSAASRRDVHRLRGRVGAVLTGMGTVRADDPRLDVRGVPARRRPVRVVVDPRGELDGASARSGLAMVGSGGSRVVSVGVSERHVAGGSACGVEYREATGDGAGGVELGSVLRGVRAEDGASVVVVEAGRGLLSGLMRGGFVDEARVYVAPTVVGDSGAMRAVELGVAERMPGGGDWTLLGVKRFGDDVRLTYVRTSRLTVSSDS